MSVLDDEPTPPAGSGLGRTVLLWVGVIAAVVGAWFFVGRAPAPPPAPAAVARPAAPKPHKTAKPDASASAVPPAADDRPSARAEAPPSASAPAPATRTGVLRVRSDVAGASVFLDRKFLGTTPLDVDGLDPGSHRLNVSAEGYEGQAQAVTIGDAPAEIEVKFKEVTLHASIPVVHKHGVGSCTGTLVADTSGLRYDTENASDAFTIGFADLDGFAVDYLKKNLRVKKRGGKTWNFEDPNGQADALFVFHRDVEKARARLAGH
jgi:hypothetical protein